MKVERAHIVSSAVAALCAAALLLTATPVSAQQAQDFITLGPSFGFAAHLGTPIAGLLGAEVTYTHYEDNIPVGLGVFTQVHSVGFEHTRAALGPQVNLNTFGLELGPFIEERSPGYGTTVGLQACPFASIGVLSLAMRISIPFTALAQEESYAVELGLVVAVKAPIAIGGKLIAF